MVLLVTVGMVCGPTLLWADDDYVFGPIVPVIVFGSLLLCGNGWESVVFIQLRDALPFDTSTGMLILDYARMAV